VSRLYNLSPKSYLRNNYTKRDIGLENTNTPNLIKELVITRPNQVWCADFTYLKYYNRTYYLATVIDAYSKDITGFSLSSLHNTELISTAFNIAVIRHGRPEITHNDQGSEYRSESYLNLLSSLNILPSNSAKSSPWQNGYQESFYGKFKPELELELLPYGSSYLEMYNYIANQIDYYNNYRIHTSIMNTPSNYRQQYKNNKLSQNQGKNSSLLEENLVSTKVGA
jgi:transposase InsO family protein